MDMFMENTDISIKNLAICIQIAVVVMVQTRHALSLRACLVSTVLSMVTFSFKFTSPLTIFDKSDDLGFQYITFIKHLHLTYDTTSAIFIKETYETASFYPFTISNEVSYQNRVLNIPYHQFGTFSPCPLPAKPQLIYQTLQLINHSGSNVFYQESLLLYHLI